MIKVDVIARQLQTFRARKKAAPLSLLDLSKTLSGLMRLYNKISDIVIPSKHETECDQPIVRASKNS